jgi:TusA-related sulfurtransferase
MSDNVVDARGLSCPEPVMLASQALKKAQKGKVVFLVDSGTARENIVRLSSNSGWKTTIEEQQDGSHRITAEK